ncbi:WD40 repeat domain-containing protein [Ktedonobacter racemifer]|uniref:WD40 repeat domain-containing protein n=1 Tax=Ktedonobacter racemifer TaxID=363277 RepID=UPI001B7F9231|nr:WD40 repeat domain-containing protein [Ktedonobacter racemifer]
MHDLKNPSQSPLYDIVGLKSPVYGIAWSPDGKHIISAENNSTVTLVDTFHDPDAPNKTYFGPSDTYLDHSGPVYDVAWSPDGTRVAWAGHDKIVVVLSVYDGVPTYNRNSILTYGGHNAAVHAVAWSPDGTRIVSASSDGTIHIWNAQTGKTLLTKNQEGEILAVAWAPFPRGEHIASGGTHKAVHIWDTTDGHIINTYQKHTGTIFNLAWSSGGSPYIASASADGTVQVWDAYDKHADKKNILTYTGHRDAVHSVTWSPDGNSIASGSTDGTVHIWSTKNPMKESSTSLYQVGSAVNVVAWSPDGSYIASGSDDKIMNIWKAPKS